MLLFEFLCAGVFEVIFCTAGEIGPLNGIVGGVVDCGS